MSERATHVRVIRIEYNCDFCEEPMLFTGIELTSYPPQYPHHCPNGHRKRLDAIYPQLKYVPWDDTKADYILVGGESIAP